MGAAAGLAGEGEGRGTDTAGVSLRVRGRGGPILGASAREQPAISLARSAQFFAVPCCSDPSAPPASRSECPFTGPWPWPPASTPCAFAIDAPCAMASCTAVTTAFERPESAPLPKVWGCCRRARAALLGPAAGPPGTPSGTRLSPLCARSSCAGPPALLSSPPAFRSSAGFTESALRGRPRGRDPPLSDRLARTVIAGSLRGRPRGRGGSPGTFARRLGPSGFFLGRPRLRFGTFGSRSFGRFGPSAGSLGGLPLGRFSCAFGFWGGTMAAAMGSTRPANDGPTSSTPAIPPLAIFVNSAELTTEPSSLPMKVLFNYGRRGSKPRMSSKLTLSGAFQYFRFNFALTLARAAFTKARKSKHCCFTLISRQFLEFRGIYHEFHRYM